jgi:hypothetical protein
MRLGKDEVARQLISRDEGMAMLRDTSPFMRVFGFDMGRNMPVVFTDETIRRRLWRLAKRLVKMKPDLSEVRSVKP